MTPYKIVWRADEDILEAIDRCIAFLKDIGLKYEGWGGCEHFFSFKVRYGCDLHIIVKHMNYMVVLKPHLHYGSHESHFTQELFGFSRLLKEALEDMQLGNLILTRI